MKEVEGWVRSQLYFSATTSGPREEGGHALGKRVGEESTLWSQSYTPSPKHKRCKMDHSEVCYVPVGAEEDSLDTIFVAQVQACILMRYRPEVAIGGGDRNRRPSFHLPPVTRSSPFRVGLLGHLYYSHLARQGKQLSQKRILS